GVANRVEGAFPLFLRAGDLRGAVGDPALELGVAALDAFFRLLLRGMEAGVLHRRRDERSQRRELVELAAGEAAALLPAHRLEHADQLASADQRNGDQRSGLDPRLLVERAVDQVTVARVFAQHGFAGGDHAPGDAFAFVELALFERVAGRAGHRLEGELSAP